VIEAFDKSAQGINYICSVVMLANNNNKHVITSGIFNCVQIYVKAVNE